VVVLVWFCGSPTALKCLSDRGRKEKEKTAQTIAQQGFGLF